MSVRPKPRLLPAVLMGLAYFALAIAAIKLTRFEGGVAFISVANAALLARLLTLHVWDWTRHVVTCAVAGAIATACFGLGTAAALPMVPMNIGEVLIAAWMLQAPGLRAGTFGSHAPLPWFLAAAGIVAPMASAFGGAAVATAFGADTYWHNWFNWYAGHALGLLTFVPITVYVLRGDASTWTAVARMAKAWEAAGLVIFVAAVAAGVFVQEGMPLLFLPILPIILTTFRLGRLGAAVSVVLLVTIGGYFTLYGNGPIGMMAGSIGHRVHFLQFYLACTVITVLPISAELARRSALYRRLHDSEARYRLLTEHSTDIILNLDIDGRIRFASPSIQQIGILDPDSVVGRRAAELVDPRDASAVVRAHLDAMSDPTKTVVVEYRAPDGSGETRWFETHTRAVVDGDAQITGAVSAIRDVGHRKAVERRLSHAAMTDGLTGIANRSAFDARLDLAIEVAGTDGFGCVTIFDLDRFKSVNDRHGHAAGDAVLKAFADLARGRMRDLDFVARYGGEEFAVILPGATLEQARLVCDRLRATLAAAPIVVGETKIFVTVSGGVARYDGGVLPSDVLAAADAALYDAKRAGRDRLRLAA